VLGGKLEIRIFYDVIHEDDGFAHARCERGLGFFAGGVEAQVEVLEDAVICTWLSCSAIRFKAEYAAPGGA
jgi:hypothetical protein